MSGNELERLHSRVGSVESRLTVLETGVKIAQVHNDNVEKRLSSIEGTLQKLVWLIISTLIVALLGYIFAGGLILGPPT